MSDLVALSFPNHLEPRLSDDLVRQLSARLEPSDVTYREPLCWRAPGLLVAVINPTGAEGSLDGFCLSPLAKVDGTDFGHIRGRVEDGTLVVANDAVASRSLWLGVEGSVAVASTSLRAAVFLLGSFQIDPACWGWFLPAGMLGPSRSWDARLRQLPLASEAFLQPGKGPRVRPRERSGNDEAPLNDVLQSAVGSLAPHDDWVLPLSGGLDSRTLALLLPPTVQAVTWGTRSSCDDPTSDSWIARELADALGMPHRFLALDESPVPTAVVLDRFVRNSEGRTDNIIGYVDGMQLWFDMWSTGIHGVIRGDQFFGNPPRPTELAVKRAEGLIEWDDVEVLRSLRPVTPKSWDLDSASLPSRTGSESLGLWGDRVRRDVRFPAQLAPLTQIKSRYVAVANPFLADEVVAAAVRLGPRQRTDRRALRKWVAAHSPDVPFASTASLPSISDFLRKPEIVAEIRSALGSDRAEAHLPEELRAAIQEGLTQSSRGASSSARRQSPSIRFKRMVPRPARRWLAYRDPRVRVSANQIGFRILVALRAIEMLEGDGMAAAAGSGGQPG